MQIFKGGLIGFGMIGKVHTLAYKNHPLCYSQPEVSTQLLALLISPSSNYNPNKNGMYFPLVTNDPKEFFDQPLDFVDVCSPNQWHYAHVKAALQAGFPVYCEKPLARTLEEAKELAALASKNEVLNQVAFVNRYLPAIRQMKAIIKAGQIGEILSFRTHKFHQSCLDPQRPMSWRLRLEDAGGGAMLDLGIHLIDLVNYLLGSMVRIRAEMRTFYKSRPAQDNPAQFEQVTVEDWCLANVELAGGIPGVIEVNRMAAGSGESTSFEVHGSLGSVAYRHTHPDTVFVYDLKRKLWMQGAPNLPLSEPERKLEEIYPSSKFSQGDMTNRHMASQLDFLLNLKQKKPAIVDFNIAVKAQRVIEAAYESSAQDGAWIKLAN